MFVNPASQYHTRLLESQAALLNEIASLRSALLNSSSTNRQHQYHNVIANDNSYLVLGNVYHTTLAYNNDVPERVSVAQDESIQQVVNPNTKEPAAANPLQQSFDAFVNQAAKSSISKYKQDHRSMMRHLVTLLIQISALQASHSNKSGADKSQLIHEAIGMLQFTQHVSRIDNDGTY